MTDRQRERRIAIVALMQRPDQERVTRAHTITEEGSPDRYQQIPDLVSAYVAHAQGEREA